MNQRIIATFVSPGGHLDKSCLYRVWTRMNRETLKNWPASRFYLRPFQKIESIAGCCRKESGNETCDAADGFASSLPTNRHDSPPPRCVKLLQSHSHFMGRGGASLEDVSISVMVMPGSAGARAHSGS